MIEKPRFRRWMWIPIVFILIAVVAVSLSSISPKLKLVCIGIHSDAKGRTLQYRIVNDSSRPWACLAGPPGGTLVPYYEVRSLDRRTLATTVPKLHWGYEFLEIPAKSSVEFEVRSPSQEPCQVGVLLLRGTAIQAPSAMLGGMTRWDKALHWIQTYLGVDGDQRTWSEFVPGDQ